MIARGDDPDSMEAIILLAAHRAGAAVEYKGPNEPEVSWRPRQADMSGDPLYRGCVYRISQRSIK